MFPFLNQNNGYHVPPFPFNGGYDSFRQSLNDADPYVYRFFSPSFQFQHESIIPNHYQQHQIPYMFQGKIPYDENAQNEQKNKKRITKKLALTQVKQKIRASHAQFKAKKNIFKYFDPSRAPPITSLRNNQ